MKILSYFLASIGTYTYLIIKVFNNYYSPDSVHYLRQLFRCKFLLRARLWNVNILCVKVNAVFSVTAVFCECTYCECIWMAMCVSSVHNESTSSCGDLGHSSNFDYKDYEPCESSHIFYVCSYIACTYVNKFMFIYYIPMYINDIICYNHVVLKL